MEFIARLFLVLSTLFMLAGIVYWLFFAHG
ncbi:hypothetical protein HYSC106933_01945 [Hydrogenibacillus schlegelii]